MNILTRQDLINHYGEAEVARGTSDGDTIDETKLASWLSVANAKVMGYLLPNGIDDVSTLPDSSQVSLKNAARVICWYWMWKDGWTEDMENDYKAEIEWLESVRNHPTMLTGKKVADATKTAHQIPMVRG